MKLFFKKNFSKKHLVILLSFLLLVFGTIKVVGAQSADVIKACVAQPGSNNQPQNVGGQANTGSVRIVSSQSDCKTGEAYVTWNVQGPPGPPGPTGVPGPAGSGGLTVYDSQNQEVGTLFDVRRFQDMVYENEIIRKINGYAVSFAISQNEIGYDWIISPQNVRVGYTSNDCSGTPLITTSLSGQNSPPIIRPGYVTNNKAVFAGDPLGNGWIYQVHSWTTFIPPSDFGPCNIGGRDSVFADQYAWFGPLQVVDLPNFTPPFSIH